MIETVEDAQYEVQTILNEAAEDPCDEVTDMEAGDAVVSVVMMYLDDDAMALELCRRELGFVPYELRSRLGDIDFLDS